MWVCSNLKGILMFSYLQSVNVLDTKVKRYRVSIELFRDLL